MFPQLSRTLLSILVDIRGQSETFWKIPLLMSSLLVLGMPFSRTNLKFVLSYYILGILLEMEKSLKCFELLEFVGWVRYQKLICCQAILRFFCLNRQLSIILSMKC